MNTENTATPRQRWALFCITKKDYRNEILSKEEAARLIKELGTPDYKKKSNKSLSAELLDYLKEHFDEMFAGAVKSLSVKSILESLFLSLSIFISNPLSLLFFIFCSKQ